MIDISGNWIAQWDTQYKAWFYYNIKTGEKNIKKNIMTGVKKTLHNIKTGENPLQEKHRDWGKPL